MRIKYLQCAADQEQCTFVCGQAKITTLPKKNHKDEKLLECYGSPKSSDSSYMSRYSRNNLDSLETVAYICTESTFQLARPLYLARGNGSVYMNRSTCTRIDLVCQSLMLSNGTSIYIHLQLTKTLSLSILYILDSNRTLLQE